jgi:hypothetical protein
MNYWTAMKSQRQMVIMVVRNDDLWRTSRATGEVMECCPYEYNYAHGGNEWLEPTGARLELVQG